ncbi:MAG TPA: acyl-protein synthetase [Erysipelotrichaceae bacterium]|nr:acyl-protein synthetase [Erysipelotrichaceae bacterium]
MSKMSSLFNTKKKNIYNLDDKKFFLAMKENCLFHYKNNPQYKKILDKMNFDPNSLKSYSDLEKIPFIPTLYFKHHNLLSLKKSRYWIKATSSGTSDYNVSRIGLTFTDLLRGWKMIKNVFSYHRLWSIKMHRCIIFGYEPHRSNERAIAKTAHGFTFLSPSLSKDYAIRWTKDGYQVDLDNIEMKLIKYSRGKVPIRTLGFPAYTYFLLKQMKDKGIKLTLPKGSIISLGGGWKSFYKEKVDKQAFYNLVKEVLGVDDNHIFEFFGAVEHPILYTDCRYHHFHIPNYSRVIIRDVETLKPVKNGEVGLINLLTPLSIGTPLLSVMTDDLGILHEEPCPCGEKSPYLEILGRSGVEDIITCAANAEEFLKGEEP